MLRFSGNKLIPVGTKLVYYGNALGGVQSTDLATKGQLDSVEESLQSDITAIQQDIVSLEAGLPLSATVSTTNATVTTVVTIPVPATTTVLIEARVVARRTGGSSGSAEDGAAYFISGCYKSVAGTATEIGEVSIFTSEDQANFTATITASGSNALIQVTGAANNNINWKCFYTVYSVS